VTVRSISRPNHHTRYQQRPIVFLQTPQCEQATRTTHDRNGTLALSILFYPKSNILYRQCLSYPQFEVTLAAVQPSELMSPDGYKYLSYYVKKTIRLYWNYIVCGRWLAVLFVWKVLVR